MKNVNLFFLTLFIVFTSSLKAQINWLSFGDINKSEFGTSVIFGENGNLYYLSVTDSDTIPSRDISIYKLDSQGSVIWQKFYGTPGSDFASRICLMNNHLYVGGYSTTNGEGDIFVLKTDLNGNQIWLNSFGNTGDYEQISDIQPTAEGNLIVAGTAKVTSNSFSNLYALKLDSLGNKIWDYYDNDTVSVVGNAVRSLPNGSLAFVSDRKGANGYDIGATLLDKNGNLKWRRNVSNGSNRGSKNLVINNKNQIVICGEGGTSKTLFFEMSITFMDTNGVIIRDVFLPGTPKNDAAFSIDQLPNEDYIITGYVIDDFAGKTEMALIIVDSLGRKLNQTSFCPSISCIGYDIKIGLNNSFIAAGTDLNSSQNLLIVTGSFINLSLEEDYVKPVLYPNPILTFQPLRFKFPNKTTKVDLYTISGEKIKTFNYPTEEVFFTKPGTYIVNIENEAGGAWQKIIVY